MDQEAYRKGCQAMFADQVDTLQSKVMEFVAELLPFVSANPTSHGNRAVGVVTMVQMDDGNLVISRAGDFISSLEIEGLYRLASAAQLPLTHGANQGLYSVPKPKIQVARAVPKQ